MEENKILDTNKFKSPATKYEIILAEINKKPNSKDERIVKVFDILDQILPHLGVYVELMKMVKQQLFDSVFSNYDYSGAKLVDVNDPTLQRMSYYTLYKQLQNSRDEKNEQLKLELEAKELELKNKEMEIKEHKAQIDDLNQKLDEATKTIQQRDNEISQKNAEIAKLQQSIAELEEEHKKTTAELENTIENLENELDDKNKEIEYLMVYKKAYDDVYNKFSVTGNDEASRQAKRQIISTRKNQISNDILNAKRIEEQILTLINISTEEYDKFVEHQVANLSKKGLKNSDNLNQFEATKINYKQSIDSLKNEHNLIIQHRLGLEEKLYYLEIDKETTEFVKRQRAKAASNQQTGSANKGSNLLQGLEEHYDPIRKGADRDQFTMQDRVFSKWACIIQTSSNGEIWLDLSELSYCENCGEKTIICPHRMSANEAVIQVPAQTRFLKFTRPKLQFNQTVVKRALDSYKKQIAQIVPNTDLHVSENVLVLTNYSPDYVPLDLKINEECNRLLNEGDPEIAMPHNIQRIWFDYSQKTSFKREVPRPFTLDRTISIIKQFLIYLHKKEVYTNQDIMDIVGSLYEYFEKRYELEDIKFAAIYDFYSSISFYSAYSRFIEIFCHVLIGNLDRGVLNYVLYMAEVVDKIEWTEADDARIFFAIIYPYCDDDDLDNLGLDYISFSENKINKKLVWDFIMMLIMKKREPLINEVEFRLSTKVAEKYTMSEDEFCKTMEEFFFINDERQVKISYMTSLAHCFWDSYDEEVPLTKLAQIGAYYCLMQIVNELQENINKILSDHRSIVLEQETRHGGPVPNKSNQLVDIKGEYIKISEIDKSPSLI